MSALGIIVLVLMFVIAVGGPVTASILQNRHLVKTGKVKDKKNCKCKTQGVIYKVEDAGYLVPEYGRGIDTHAYYEFYVNGIRYTGVDDIYGSPFNSKTVTVLYDPKDPNINCTSYGKRDASGTNYLLALGITFGVIAVIFGFILLMLLFLRYLR